MTAIDKKYFAFISYKREDEAWAKWLQHKLEHYKLPSNLNGKSDLPKEIRPIFRDQSDLAGGVLVEAINKALENSQYLIVICSPRAAQSEWVGKEVQTFIEMGRTDKIIPFIVGGEPYSENLEDECLPLSLKSLPKEQELLGVNINEIGRDAAAVKVIARMFGLRFDDLWQRHEREKKKRRNWIISTSIVGFLVMAAVAGWIWRQNVEIKEKDWKMMEFQSGLVGEKIQSITKNDSYLARVIAMELLPKSVANPIERPYSPVAECALRMAYDKNSAIIYNNDKESYLRASFSSDGKQIVLASFDNIRIIDALTGIEISAYEIEKLKRGLRYIDLSFTGKLLSIGGVFEDSTYMIKIYETDALNLIQTLDNGFKAFCPLAFSENSGYIATLSIEDSVLKIVNIMTGQEIMTYKEPFSTENKASFSNDGKLLAIATSENLNDGSYVSYIHNGYKGVYSDNSITILDIKSGNVIKKWKGHRNIISSIAFSLDNKKVVTSSYDGTIKVWDVFTGEELISSDKIVASLNSANYSLDGKYIVTSSYDGTISIWNAETGKEEETFSKHMSEVNYAAFSPDGKRVVSTSEDQTIRLWDFGDNETSIILTNLDYPIHYRDIDISPDKKKIVTMSNDTTVIVFDLETAKTTLTLNVKKKRSKHNPVAFSHDGKKIVANYDDLTMIIYDAENGEELDTLKGHYYPTYSAYFSPDDNKVACAAMNSRFSVWNTNNSNNPNEHVRYSTINKMVFSPDGNDIIIGCMEYYYIYDIDAETFEEKRFFKGHIHGVNSISFSPDGKRFVSGSIDNTLILWDYETGESIFAMKGHSGSVYCVTYSEDGKFIVSASSDKTIRIWNADTGDCVYVIEGHTDGVSFVSFMPDGEHLVSASYDGTIRMWDFPPLQELIDQTRERFNDRQLTEEERKMYYLE